MALSALSVGGATAPTPGRVFSFAPNAARSDGGQRPARGLVQETTVGSVAPGGRPFSRVFSAVCDSAWLGMPAEDRSKVGL